MNKLPKIIHIIWDEDNSIPLIYYGRHTEKHTAYIRKDIADEMLEILRMIIENKDNKYDQPLTGFLEEKARNAIAKAEGKE